MRKTDWNPAVETIIMMRGGGLPQSDLQDFISYRAPKEFHGSCHRNSKDIYFQARYRMPWSEEIPLDFEAQAFVNPT